MGGPGEVSFVRGVVAVASSESRSIFVRTGVKRFVATGTRVGYCINASSVGRGRGISISTTVLLTRCCVRHSVRISSILYLCRARTLNTCLTRRLTEPDVLTPGPSSSVYILNPRCSTANGVVFHSGLVEVVRNGGILILVSYVADKGAIRHTVRDVDCCNNRTINISTTFDTAGRVYNLRIGAVFARSSIPDCRICGDRSYPLYGRDVPIGTVMGNCNCSGVWFVRLCVTCHGRTTRRHTPLLFLLDGWVPRTLSLVHTPQGTSTF